MTAKTRLFSRLIVFSILLARPALSFELECGTYELTGHYYPRQNLFIVAQDTASPMAVQLSGPKLLTAFSAGSSVLYRIEVRFNRHIRNKGGFGQLLDVLGLESARDIGVPFKKVSRVGCPK